MVFYADGDVRSVLQKAPPPDRAEARAVIERLYPGHRITDIDDGNLSDDPNPPDGEVYVGCFAGLTVVCTGDVALDKPSTVPPRFLAEARGRKTYVHAMHSVVDWAAFAVWGSDGALRRAVSLSPDSGIIEDLGEPYEFEKPYWAGERRLTHAPDYPLPFHPLELAEDALRAFFGFVYEGPCLDDDPDLEDVVLVGFAVQ
jgi:hypothetical protein